MLKNHKQRLSLFSVFIISTLLFCVLATSKVNSQSITDSIVYFTGQIVDKEFKRPLIFVHVFNISERRGTITDTLGYFYLHILKGDTIRISTIGYQKKYICLCDSVLESPKFFTSIELEPRVYEIARVDIYELRWQAFKEEFVKVALPTDVEMLQPGGSKWYESLFTEEEMAEVRNQIVTGIPFNLKSKQDRAREKMRELQHQLELDRIAEAKLRKLTAAYTKFRGEELDNFTRFCNFDRMFILQARDYDILIAVKQRLEFYHKLKND